MLVAALVAAVVLALVHLFGDRIHGQDVVPRGWLLSAGSGISVAYVFLHLLPEVAALQERVGAGTLGWWIAMAGLAVVYGLELFARRSAADDDDQQDGDDSRDAGLVHLASYGLYNAIIGYLLVERAHASLRELALFSSAMALHFLVNDHGLRARHQQLYHRTGRWLLGGGVVAGALLGAAVEPGPLVVEGVVAFLAGGVIMNVLKEELPEDRSSRFVPFALAAAAYGGLLLLV